MQPRDPSVRPVLALLAVLAVLLIAPHPGGRWLEALLMDPESTKALVAPAATLLGALVGGGVAGWVNYVIAKQNRVSALALDRQKGRRERETSRLAPFLDTIDQRVHRVAEATGALRARDAAKFRKALDTVLSTETYGRSAVVSMARRDNALGRALVDYMAKEGAIRESLREIGHARQFDEQKVTITVDPALIGALERAQSALTTSIADLFDAIDDYLDGPAAG